MKFVSLLVGVSIVFSTSIQTQQAQAQQLGELPELGAFSITDVTSSYPRNNYYDQLQECADLGASVTAPSTQTADAGSTAPIFSPTPTPSAGNANPGEIAIKTPGNDTSGTPSLYGGGGYAPTYPGTGIVSLDQIVNLGNFVWQIVQASRPSMRLSTYRAHGLPRGVTCWTDLEEWKLPKSKVFTVEQKSVAGKVLSKFTFRISFVYGGTYNGAGKYLANVTVSPVDLQVAWGSEFGSEVQIPAVFNIGTKANPIAAMQIFVYWNLGSAVKMQQKSQMFTVTGNGDIQQEPN